MPAQYPLLLSTIAVILIGLSATLMIREPQNTRKAKPLFVGFFVSSLILNFHLIHVPDFHAPWEHMVVDVLFMLNIALLSIGITIRFNKCYIERSYYLFLSGYLTFYLFGPYYPILPVLFGLINTLLIIWMVLTRDPKPNIADFGLVVTLFIWFGILLYDVSTHTPGRAPDFFGQQMVTNLIFVPAFMSGISVFILASYMMDSHILLERLASKDELTDMLNRRGLFEQITTQLSYLKRKKQPASVIIADIDHFKNINDTYGHEAGDKAIRQFASVIKHVVREYDISARYGGEEFVIFLPGANAETAFKVAERIRLKCESGKLVYRNNTIVFTASFGVAQFQFDKKIEMSIHTADEALYTSKLTGRNKVSIK
ncbi:hypothetical protein CSW98_06095 [Vibrio sp. HA2012]|uniref:GGDEF domain-containing protein n=1 Tax=Vibrio sp. HA2012 TaxID=1971595 RepID=UPI000C2BC433|nr:GGDEF domain-containing protein [Vibrio sp. HA2012]PJC87462.1 hypothetical protein CSW98_06095 [Vibrio sp. HA2012]